MKDKIIVLGDNYIGSAFNGTYEIWNAQCLIEQPIWENLFQDVSTIINCIDEKEGPLSDIWHTNYGVVNDLARFCRKYSIKLVHISTAELYGNQFDWEMTKECAKVLDMNTDYRMSKRVGERMIESTLPNSLIIRIKNPFDGRYHLDNWLVKCTMRTKLYNWIDSHTYLPDLVRAIGALLTQETTGVVNVVQFEAKSALFYLKNILSIPAYLDIDGDIHDNPLLINELDNECVHADVNCELIQAFIRLTPMDTAVVLSYESLKNYIDKAI